MWSRAVVGVFATVLVVVGLSQGVAQAAVKPVRVVDDRFVPRQLTVKSGDAVRWSFSRANRNRHNVTARRTPRGVSNRSFTSGPAISGGKVFRRTFRRPGTYRFSCTLHFGMNMRVNVKRR